MGIFGRRNLRYHASMSNQFFPVDYASTPAPEEAWSPALNEGELALDVFRDGKDLVIRSPVAGVRPEDIDVALNGDLLTIRGIREDRAQAFEEDWFVRECYWGSFSRSIVLPLDVFADQTQATIRNGVLEIRIPLRQMEHRVTIRAVAEE